MSTANKGLCRVIPSMTNVAVTLALFLLILGTDCVRADIEYTRTDPLAVLADDAAADAQDEIDYKLLENSVCGANKNVLWKFIRTHVDLDRDDLLDKRELREAIANRTRAAHERELTVQVTRLDPQQTGRVEFKTYMADLFDIYDLDDLLMSSDQDLAELRAIYTIQKSKWDLLSEHTDYLDYDRFYQFVYSEEFASVRDYEEDISFQTYDTDHDGFLSVEEFWRAFQNLDESVLDMKNKQFTATVDWNADNKIDRDEFKSFYNQSIVGFQEDELQFLMSGADIDNDGVLSRDEVEANCAVFLKVQLTNFGADLGELQTGRQHAQFTPVATHSEEL